MCVVDQKVRALPEALAEHHADTTQGFPVMREEISTNNGVSPILAKIRITTKNAEWGFAALIFLNPVYFIHHFFARGVEQIRWEMLLRICFSS